MQGIAIKAHPMIPPNLYTQEGRLFSFDTCTLRNTHIKHNLSPAPRRGGVYSQHQWADLAPYLFCLPFVNIYLTCDSGDASFSVAIAVVALYCKHSRM